MVLRQLADNDALELGLGCGPSQNFWAICFVQQAGFCCLPSESELFFLSDCRDQAATASQLGNWLSGFRCSDFFKRSFLAP